jgi:signal transduction protein with GAF and PtsI domain
MRQINLPDAPSHPGFDPLIAGALPAELGGLMAIPVPDPQGPSKALGVLVVTRQVRGAFSDVNVILARAVAAHLGVLVMHCAMNHSITCALDEAQETIDGLQVENSRVVAATASELANRERWQTVAKGMSHVCAASSLESLSAAVWKSGCELTHASAVVLLSVDEESGLLRCHGVTDEPPTTDAVDSFAARLEAVAVPERDVTGSPRTASVRVSERESERERGSHDVV